jgi:hypothetical protein
MKEYNSNCNNNSRNRIGQREINTSNGLNSNNNNNSNQIVYNNINTNDNASNMNTCPDSNKNNSSKNSITVNHGNIPCYNNINIYTNNVKGEINLKNYVMCKINKKSSGSVKKLNNANHNKSKSGLTVNDE